MKSYAGLAGQYDAFTGDVPYGAFADFYEQIFSTRGKTPPGCFWTLPAAPARWPEMTARGYELIAADASAEMLSEVMDKFADAPGARPILLCQRMQELDLYGTVDAVYCSLDSINYLTAAEVRELLRRLALFTEIGGLLIFDTFAPARYRALDGQVFVDESADALCLWRAEFDEAGSRLVYGMDIFQRAGELWRREQEEHIEYAHSETFFTDALAEAGFYDIEILRDGPQSGQGRIFFVSANSGKGMREHG
jgi:hypothetical protein